MPAQLDPTLIVYAALAVATVVWLLGLRSTVRAFFTQTGRTTRGEVDVPAPPGAVSQHLARLLAEGRSGVTARIERATADEVRATLRVFWSQTRKGRTYVRQARGHAMLTCRLIETGSGTRVAWTLDTSKLGQSLVTGAVVLQALSAVAIVACGLLLPTYVAQHANPAVRWQAVQVIHVAHFLWPPFLLAHMANKGRGIAREQMAELLQNLPYLMPQGSHVEG